ncbi:MAG: hydrogenase formation protein HypD [Myxococcota bacterium]|nr:hydrogenase formation protein HypD [Myxococcota bacterium]
MKFLDEYRDEALARRLADRIARATTRPWTLMEVCGGQTHAIVRFGIDRLLPPEIELVHGPGCPVCVTPIEIIDRALELAAQPRTALCTFGDMARVPGSGSDLLGCRAEGGDVRIVYSPLDAVEMAAAEPEREFVFLAVGFETTAPANAMAVLQARRRGLRNFSLLVAHVLVPPAMEAILSAPDHRVQGFLAAGHVCTVTGWADYHAIARTHRVPIVVTGFEPVDVLQGVAMCVEQLEAGRYTVENQYRRSARPEGNRAARATVDEVFEVADRRWRGIGVLPRSGLRIRPELGDFDAERRFGPVHCDEEAESPCIAGRILRGRAKPDACPAFGTTCTPEHPLGAPMVSSEGACSAYLRYRGTAGPSDATESARP